MDRSEVIQLVCLPLIAVVAFPLPSRAQQPSQTYRTDAFVSDHPRFSLMSADCSPGSVQNLISRPGGLFDGPILDLVNVESASTPSPLHQSFAGGVTLHLAHRRLEIFGTATGLFVPSRTIYTMPNAWLSQTDIGVRWALDPGRRVWLGGTAHYLTDLADKRRQWAYESADFTVQFGKR